MSTRSHIVRPQLARERREAVFGNMPHAHRRILQRTAIKLRAVGHNTTAVQLYSDRELQSHLLQPLKPWNAPARLPLPPVPQGTVTGRFSARNPPESAPPSKSPLTGSAGALAPVSPAPAFLHDPEPAPITGLRSKATLSEAAAKAKRSDAARRAAVTRKVNAECNRRQQQNHDATP